MAVALWACIWMVVTPVAAAADGQTITMPDPRQGVEPGAGLFASWIADLTYGDQVTQQKAHAHLVAAGDDAVPAINQALAGLTTPPVRQRMNAVLDVIARNDALRGPLITLDLQSQTLRTIFTRLCKPVGIHPTFFTLRASGAPDPKYFDRETLTLNVNHQPFWKVILRIQKVTGIGPEVGNFGDNRLNFSKISRLIGKKTSVNVQGPFLMLIHWWPKWVRQLSLQQEKKSSREKYFTVPMTTLWCPNGNYMSSFGPAKVLHATDSTGRSLIAPAPKQPARPRYAYQGRGKQQTMFPSGPRLKRPAPAAKTFNMRGVIPVTMSFGVHRYRTKITAGEDTLAIRGVTFTFGEPTKLKTKVKAEPFVWIMPFTISTPVMDQRKAPLVGLFTKMNILGWGPHLVIRDAAGRRLRFDGAVLGEGIGAYYHWTLKIEGEPATAEIILYRCREVHLKIPFEFKNVAIPSYLRSKKGP